MQTEHELRLGDARLIGVRNEFQLIVTSPPYPMVPMWDNIFGSMNPSILRCLSSGEYSVAFSLMHRELDRAWKACYAALVEGGILCVVIGDALSRRGKMFSIYSNSGRVIAGIERAGFLLLPSIIWRKEGNKPNKFLGSGMLPPSAYPTLDHEYILIARKGGPRSFSSSERRRRGRSAYFWEERNEWFSDIWNGPKGVKQIGGSKTSAFRSGAFPLELPYRLINMFSLEGDRVLDPFIGTGTTMLACMIAARNSTGYEINSELLNEFKIDEFSLDMANELIEGRLSAHCNFVERAAASGRHLIYRNTFHSFPVLTSQEIDLHLRKIISIEEKGRLHFTVHYR